MAVPWQVICEVGTTPGLNPSGWSDVSGRLQHGFDIQYGRAHELGRDETGVCNLVLDNTDGRWNPGIPPHTAIRFSIAVGQVIYPFWNGLIEAAPTVWPSPAGAEVHAKVTDGQGLLSRADVTVQLPQQKSGARIGSLLDAAGWPALQRDIDLGVVDVLPLNDDGAAVTINVLNEIRSASQAEDGHVYVDPDGSYVFRDRHSRLDVVSSGSFDDTTPPVDVKTQYDDLRLFTVGRAEMSDGEIIEFTDDAGVAAYGHRVYELRDLGTSLVEAEAAAAWMVERYGQPRLRFERVEVDGRKHDLGQLLTLRPGDVIQIAGTPPSGAPITELVHIERVKHRVSGWSWRTTFQLSSYFGAGPWFTLDSSSLDSDAKLAP